MSSLREKEGTALQFVGQPINKIEDFLAKMSRGDSASKAAKDLKTTVRTMSKQTYKGSPIIKKEKGRWVSQFIPEEKLVLHYYGHLKNPQGNVLGGNNVSTLMPHLLRTKRKGTLIMPKSIGM